MSQNGASTATRVRPAAAGWTTNRRVLVVGPARTRGWTTAQGRTNGETEALFVHTRFAHLTRDLLYSLRPDAVLAPLITDDWDVLDLAEFLDSHGYGGQLLVQSRPLPRADLVLGEVRALFPGIALELVELTD